MFRPRPHQQRIVDYTTGKMGVSAVPGSGKTQTLSSLAAKLIMGGYMEDDQEVLVVTLVNSAVDNFSTRIRGFLAEGELLLNYGYRVRTLHGLAHDIVRERPDLAGLSSHFTIIDENESNEILKEAVTAWMRSHPGFINDYTHPDVNEEQLYKLQKAWPDLLVDLAGNIIRQAKDLQFSPENMRQRLGELGQDFPLLRFGSDIFTDYQRALNFRESVDFDDLISMALNILEIDPDYLQRLRYRWPYILEDEAQDSSLLQERILRKLAGEDGNWVRVGDPNQAIYETFTTANPKYLLNFLSEPGVQRCTLPNSGRSTLSIIRLANLLIDWTCKHHPVEELRGALVLPHIEPTPPGDPQPNPPDDSGKIYIHTNKLTPERELTIVVRSIQQWLPDHPDATVAVLVPRNERGNKLVEELKKSGIDYHELLGSSSDTRQTADILSKILRCLADPNSTLKLSRVYQSLRPIDRNQPDASVIFEQSGEMIKRCSHLEDYLWPKPGSDWLADLANDGTPIVVLAELDWLRSLITTWQNAAALPIDQLVLTIAQTLFDQPTDLALAHKLAQALEREAQLHPDWQLPLFCDRLDSIARNERRFIGLSADDTGFDPDIHKGKVVVATIHKAKGLEWDRVYLLSVNNYDFPSAQLHDSFIGERWFVRDHLNLQAEALMQLIALASGDTDTLYLQEGFATQEARLDYARERLRLLFVGITRARKDLSLTWNTGRSNNEALPALALWELNARFFTGEE